MFSLFSVANTANFAKFINALGAGCYRTFVMVLVQFRAFVALVLYGTIYVLLIIMSPVLQALVFTGHNATLCNLLCLAVDHYCAIAKPLTYSVYMSKRRVHIILGTLWIIAVLFGFSDFLVPAPLHDYCADWEFVNYCERVGGDES